MKVLAGVLLGLCIGLALRYSYAQSPDPCFYLTFTPSVVSTQTTVPLPSQTLFPTLTRPPSLTPTYDFATHTIFQTATAIKIANQTQEAKWTASVPFNTPSQEVWTETPVAPTPQAESRYLVIAPIGLNVRQLASINSEIVTKYVYGQTVTVTGNLVEQTVNGVNYKWGFTSRGWIATQVGNTVYARKQ